MTKSDLARKYRREHGMEMPTLKLARIMYNENKLLFKNVDHARSSLRAIEGKSGQNVKVLDEFKCEERPRNPYKLPVSSEQEWKPYKLDAKRTVIFNDLHAPYHNIEAITTAINYCKKEKPDTLLINGDLFDFHSMSRFMKDPSKKNFAEEIKIGCDLVNVIAKELKVKKIVFKLGNHDERYGHFLMEKAKELIGLDEFKFDEIMRKRVKGVELVEDKRIVKMNELNVVHGHEFGGSVFSPVNIARGFYMRAKASTIGGHHHRTSEHTEKSIEDKIVTTFSIGCLCELHPQYLPINNWNYGFAIVDQASNGIEYDVRNKRIYKGNVY